MPKEKLAWARTSQPNGNSDIPEKRKLPWARTGQQPKIKSFNELSERFVLIFKGLFEEEFRKENYKPISVEIPKPDQEGAFPRLIITPTANYKRNIVLTFELFEETGIMYAIARINSEKNEKTKEMGSPLMINFDDAAITKNAKTIIKWLKKETKKGGFFV